MRDIVLGADPSMRERIRYGITFSSTGGDFAPFVRCSEPGVNLRLMRGRRLHGRYPHLEGATVKRMRIADGTEASARAAELRSMVKEWCALGDAAKAKTTAKRAATSPSSAPYSLRKSRVCASGDDWMQPWMAASPLCEKS